MLIKTPVIPTLVTLRKGRAKKVESDTTQGMLNLIHNAICANMPYTDLPMTIHNIEDEKITMTIIGRFIKKGYDIKAIAERPIKVPAPWGMVEYKEVLYRCQLKEQPVLYRCQLKEQPKEVEIIKETAQ